MEPKLPFRIVIIDDEPDAIKIIRTFLTTFCPDLEIVGEAGDVPSGVSLIRHANPNLILLDIQLGNATGFDILNKFNQPNFRVIFITAHDQFALKAFQYNAMDYLLKPIDPDALIKAVDKVKKLIHRDFLFDQQLGNLLQNIRAKTFDKITLSTSEGLVFVDLENILYLKSDINYTQFVINGGEKILVSKPLKDFEALLPKDSFFRIHQSYLVNIRYVNKVLKEDGGYALLENGTQIPISRRKKEAFLNLLMQ